MDNVVAFKKPESEEPWMSGTGYCMECKHEWAASGPAGVQCFECPACGTYKGTWMGVVEPPDERWECACGGQLFFVTKAGFDCARCGTTQNY